MHTINNGTCAGALQGNRHLAGTCAWQTLADLIMRMVVLLQQRASGPAADEDQDADEAQSEEGMLQFAESVLGLC